MAGSVASAPSRGPAPGLDPGADSASPAGQAIGPAPTAPVLKPPSRSVGAFIRHYFHIGSWPFWGIHLLAIVGVILSGWSWTGLALAVTFYFARMFFVCVSYHRYFSHRTFKTSRPMQFLLAVAANTSAQKGVLWWAAHHRTHHKYSDQEGDVHSAKREGFWWSHVGWVIADNPDRDHGYEQRVKDLTRFRELRWLEHVNLLPAVALAVVLAMVGGWHALLWGFFVSTVLLWHGTFTVNSLSHMIGRRRYATTDNSKNSALIAIWTLGEGWHNNHHHYMTSANQGFRWWEYDPPYYALKVMSWFGLVWDLRTAPPHVVAGVPKDKRRAVAAPPRVVAE